MKPSTRNMTVSMSYTEWEKQLADVEHAAKVAGAEYAMAFALYLVTGRDTRLWAEKLPTGAGTILVDGYRLQLEDAVSKGKT